MRPVPPSPWPALNYICVCSGISAPTQAWGPHGWKALAFAEIDPFASAVLAYRYGASRPRFMPRPEDAKDEKERRRRATAIKALDRIEWGSKVRNEGDFTRMRDEDFIGDADVLVGGTPCQGFSLAGLRGSLSDDRSNLALEFIRLADAIDDFRLAARKQPAFILWENVPGVFTVEDNAFGTFLGGLVGSDEPIVPPGGAGWTDAGVVSGPSRVAAWRVLDTQHFGLPQRRRRVFVLARRHPGAWHVADALLPIIDSMRGHPAPSRKTGEGVARSLSASTGGPSAKEQQYTFVAGDRPLNALEGGEDDAPRPDSRGRRGAGRGRSGGGLGDVAGTVSAKWAKGTGGPSGDEAYNLVAVPEQSPPVLAGANTTGGNRFPGCAADDAEGLLVVEPIAFDPTQITHPENRSNPQPGAPCHTLPAKGHPPVVAFSAKDHGQDASEDLSPTLRAMPHDKSHPNGGGQVAIAFSLRGRDGENMIEPEAGDVAPALRTGEGGSSKPFVAYSLSPQSGADGPTLAVEVDIAPAITAEGEAKKNGRGLHIVEPGYIHPRQIRGSETSNQVGIKPDATVADALTTEGPGAVMVEEPFAFKPSHYTRGKDGAPSDKAPALTADADKGDQDPLVMAFNITPSNSNQDYNAREASYAQALTASHGPPSSRGGDVVITTAVRRLTCRECERLQGFEDDFTLIPHSDARRDEKDLAETIEYLRAAGHGANEAAVLAATPDGPRYRVLGNTMSVDVIEELGSRIAWAASL